MLWLCWTQFQRAFRYPPSKAITYSNCYTVTVMCSAKTTTKQPRYNILLKIETCPSDCSMNLHVTLILTTILHSNNIQEQVHTSYRCVLLTWNVYFIRGGCSRKGCWPWLRQDLWWHRRTINGHLLHVHHLHNTCTHIHVPTAVFVQMRNWLFPRSLTTCTRV